MSIRLHRTIAVGAVIATCGLGPAFATAAPSGPPGPTPYSGVLSAEVRAAMQRDLGLDEQQARVRLGQQQFAGRAQQRLGAVLGEDMAGAYFDSATGRLVVNLTNAQRADEVRAAGATPKLVRHSAARLRSAVTALTEAAARGQLAAVHVDERTNTIVARAMPGRADEVRELRDRTGFSEELVRVTESAVAPRVAVDLRGGDGYSSGIGNCSVGYPITTQDGTPGFITAGHCSMGGTGPEVSIGGEAAGVVEGARFPGDIDGAWVKSPPSANATSLVNDYDGGTVTVTGNEVTPVGGDICRSGATSGWHCGTIQAKDVTVDYGDLGKVTGLTQTNACADPGDSGGTVLSGDQVQGVTSGVDGGCKNPLPPDKQHVYYQEAQELFDRWQLAPVLADARTPSFR